MSFSKTAALTLVLGCGLLANSVHAGSDWERHEFIWCEAFTADQEVGKSYPKVRLISGTYKSSAGRPKNSKDYDPSRDVRWRFQSYLKTAFPQYQYAPSHQTCYWKQTAFKEETKTLSDLVTYRREFIAGQANMKKEVHVTEWTP